MNDKKVKNQMARVKGNLPDAMTNGRENLCYE